MRDRIIYMAAKVWVYGGIVAWIIIWTLLIIWIF